MAQRLVDDTGAMDFVDENGIACFVDDNDNFTCAFPPKRQKHVSFNLALALAILVPALLMPWA